MFNYIGQFIIRKNYGTPELLHRCPTSDWIPMHIFLLIIFMNLPDSNVLHQFQYIFQFYFVFLNGGN